MTPMHGTGTELEAVFNSTIVSDTGNNVKLQG
jgi:hypothetical protein